jgi:hypothetical protein
MNSIIGPGCASPSPTSVQNFDESEEADFLKEVWIPSGNALRFLEIETAFCQAGYVLKRSELSPHTPPVAIFRFARRTAPFVSETVQFAEHISQILETVSIRVPKRALTAQNTHNSMLIAFLWQPEYFT